MNWSCVAHRGVSGSAPENTMAAFMLAIDDPDIEWIECDVQLSQDGIPVIIHDPTVNRTTNGRGRVRDFTALQLSQLDAGSWFHASFGHMCVPTLVELLHTAKGKCKLNIELKPYSMSKRQLLLAVADAVHKTNMENEVMITSFDEQIIRMAKSLSPQLKRGLIFDYWDPGIIIRLKALDVNIVSIRHHLLNNKRNVQLKQLNLQMMVWTVNSYSMFRKLLKYGENFLVCTNYPDRYKKVVKEYEQLQNRGKAWLGWLRNGG